MTRALKWGGLLLVAVLVAVQWMERDRRRELRRAREAVADAREDARTCVRDLAIQEEAFQRLTTRVDSVRDRIAVLEGLDPRGVPADRYEEYLGAVDDHNEGVEGWSAAGEALRTAEETCRARVERYNALADSLRAESTETEFGS